MLIASKEKVKKYEQDQQARVVEITKELEQRKTLQKVVEGYALDYGELITERIPINYVLPETIQSLIQQIQAQQTVSPGAPAEGDRMQSPSLPRFPSSEADHSWVDTHRHRFQSPESRARPACRQATPSRFQRRQPDECV